ncbi:MAG: hypothetical protein ACSHX6_02570 [Akkermansiaceae bacterium]
MKRIISSLTLLMACATAEAGTVINEDFSNDWGDFTALNNTQVMPTNNGFLEFTSTNNQGSGVILDFLDDFPGDIASDTAPQTLYFEISVVVPLAVQNAQEELGFFLGPVVTEAQSGAITTGQNTNGFTFYINDGAVFAPDNSQGTAYTGAGNGQAVNLLSGLAAGSIATFSLEWMPVPAQNSGQSNNVFTLTVDGFNSSGVAITASETFDGAQNRNNDDVNDYQFVASTTTGLTASIDNFTVSNMPIPEPSTSLLTLICVPALLLRRRRD